MSSDPDAVGPVVRATPTSAWVSCDQRPQIEEEFGGVSRSIDVIFTDGKEQWIGYMETWENDEYEPTWKMKGPDGWDVENVTHWMPLPPLPQANDA
jgi:hypothetical protein